LNYKSFNYSASIYHAKHQGRMTRDNRFDVLIGPIFEVFSHDKEMRSVTLASGIRLCSECKSWEKFRANLDPSNRPKRLRL